MNSLTSFLGDANAAPVIVALGAGLTVMLMVAALATMRSPVRTRTLGRLSTIGAVGHTYQPTTSPLQDRRASTIPLLDSLIGGRGWVDHTREQLGRAGVPLRVGEYISLRTLAVVIGAAIGLLMAQRAGGEPLARFFFFFLGAGAGWFIPPIMLKVRLQRRQQQIETQLVELCDVMASMLQSGYGYVQALTATADEVGPPLSLELQRMLDTVRLGGDIDDALDELNERLGSRDFDMVATAISIQRRSGGNLGEILSGVAETIRQRQSFAREVRALTSRERFTAIIVAAIPLVLIAILTWMAPETYGRLFTDRAGQVMLGIALTLDFAGFMMIRKLSQIEV
jgi:tight adherence protein B